MDQLYLQSIYYHLNNHINQKNNSSRILSILNTPTDNSNSHLHSMDKIITIIEFSTLIHTKPSLILLLCNSIIHKDMDSNSL
jgi:hypothetical protein